MKMPTIHCMGENGKILCGNKRANFYMELAVFKKELKKDSLTLMLGGCSKCESIVKAMPKKSTPKINT